MPNGCADKLIFRMAALAFVLGGAAPARAGSIALWRESAVADGEVRLSDVCQFRGITAAEVRRYADIVVAAGPVVGGSVIVTMDEVRRALQGAEVNLADIVLKGAASCDVTRSQGPAPQRAASVRPQTAVRNNSRTLRDAVEGFLTAELAGTGGRVRVQYGRVAEAALELREPEFEFEVRRTSGRRLGLVGLEVVVLSDGARVQSIPLMVNVSYVRSVVVAARAINLGATVGPGDLRLAEMTFNRFDQAGTEDPAGVIGQRAKRFIPAGDIVTQRQLEPVPLVTRGQIVDVCSRVGGVAIVSAAKALGSGAYGDVVALRGNRRGADRFSATVTGPGRVSVRGQEAVLAMRSGR